jgi:predicted O-methyltransferase YrrM
MELSPASLGWRTRVLLGIARASRRLSEEVAVHAAREAIARTVAARPSIEEALAFAYGFTFFSFNVAISPRQVPSEIEALLELVRRMHPRTIVEIGSAQGGTLFLLATVADDDALIISVDLPMGRFGGGYLRRRQKLYRAFARKDQRIELLQADSHESSTVHNIYRMVGKRGVDVLFIDGDHSYEGVERDYAAYSPLVREGGLVVFHDIVPGEEEYVDGVPRFWRELKATRYVEELVGDWGQGGYGIGVVPKRAN